VEHGDRKDGRWTVAGGVELGDALDEARALAPQRELKWTLTATPTFPDDPTSLASSSVLLFNISPGPAGCGVCFN
jgi:hypothetical protein